MELTTTIFEVAKTWAVSYGENGQPDKERTLSCMLTEMAEFASNVWMPNLMPLFKVVCSYARVCKNEKELEEAWSVLNALNELDNTFHTYNPTLGILEVAHDRYQAQQSEEAKNRKEEGDEAIK